MQMKKISDEDNLARRREMLTEEEAEILIERFRAKTTALVTLILMHLNREKNYSSNLGFKSIATYYSIGSMLDLVINNHKKGILPITDDECRFIIDHDYAKDQNIFNCLMGSLSSDTKSSLKKEIATHYELLKDCYNANVQKRCYFGEYVKIIATSLDIFSLRVLLNDNEMDESTKSLIYSAYIQERPFSDECNLIFVNGTFHESEINDQLDSLTYLERFSEDQDEDLLLAIYGGTDVNESPVLDYYYAGNYTMGKKIFETCYNCDNFDLSRKILFFLLDNKRFKEVLELVSTKAFNIRFDDEVIAKIKAFIPEDQFYSYMEEGNSEDAVGITDEFTKEFVGILAKKARIFGDKMGHKALNDVLLCTRRTEAYNEKRSIMAGREAVVQTLGALHEVAEDTIPWKHMIKDMPYGGKRSE